MNKSTKKKENENSKFESGNYKKPKQNEWMNNKKEIQVYKIKDLKIRKYNREKTF